MENTPLSEAIPTEPRKLSLQPIYAVLLLILGILMGAGGLAAYQEFFKASVTQPLTEEQQNLEGSTEMTDWNTYTNTLYAYTVRYPPTWTMRENEPGVFSNQPPSTYIFEKEGDLGSGIYIWVAPSIDLKEWIQEAFADSNPEYTANIEEISVAGFPGTKISGIPGPLEQELVSVNTGNQTVVLYANAMTDMTIFHQILSTFTFQDVNTNEVMGIQTSVCCGCPTVIPASQIGTDGWVSYVKGNNYSRLLPKQCTLVDCAPCPPQ